MKKPKARLGDVFRNQPPLNQVYATSDFAQGVERGRLLERERIIKMLESIKDYPSGWDYNDEIASVVALIKSSGLRPYDYSVLKETFPPINALLKGEEQ